MVAPEGPTARIERALEQFTGEARVGAVEAICLAAKDPGVKVPIGRVGPGGEEDSRHRCLHVGPRRVGTDLRRVVRVGDVEIARSRHERRDRHQESSVFHGRRLAQKSRSTEKKKLRLGGNGATSMFRATA